jgi:hypothetical protein
VGVVMEGFGKGGGRMGLRRKFTRPQTLLYFGTTPNFYLLWSAGDERVGLPYCVQLGRADEDRSA